MGNVVQSDGGEAGPGVGSQREIDELHALRALLRAVDQVWQALATRAGMRVVEIIALELLHFTSPSSSRQIADRTGLTAPGVTGLIDRFETRGLTRRIRRPENRRVVLVELTSVGREFTTNLFGSLVTLIEQAARHTDVPELAVRVQCLDYTADLLHQAATLATTPEQTSTEP